MERAAEIDDSPSIEVKSEVVSGTFSDLDSAKSTTGNDDLEDVSTLTPTKSTSSQRSPKSSNKRRRLARDIENGEGEFKARKLIYEPNDSDDSDDDCEDEHPVSVEWRQLEHDRILRRVKEVNGEDEDDQLLHMVGSAKIFEYLSHFDVVKGTFLYSSTGVDLPSVDTNANGKLNNVGKWVYRGSGRCLFVKCMEEGYNRGMIRMQVPRDGGALELLLCHEITFEEAAPMPSKKGKAYTWRCRDWAYQTCRRTFAIRFDDEMEAIKWKDLFEQSKQNNNRVRRGIDIPELPESKDVVDICSDLKSATISTHSKK